MKQILQQIPEKTMQKLARQRKLSVKKIYSHVTPSHPESIKENHYSSVINLLKNKKYHLVAEIAPSIRVSIGEEFGYPAGKIIIGKMIAALKQAGFDKVFDTNLGADILMVEESNEFLRRIKNNEKLPMITTCCPAWIRYMEHFYHDLIPNMSTCKSPHEMLGILAKKYYAKKSGIKQNNIKVISIMPCTAKRYESQRPELKSAVDYVLTTTEAADLIKHFEIDFHSLDDDTAFDSVLGISTGASAIFGATGGVMEATMRTAYELATGKKAKLEFKKMHGMKGIKQGEINLNGKKIKCAAANGLGNAKPLLKEYEKYDFIEIMACPGGCIGGGGQPQPHTNLILKKRIKALYQQDKNLKFRKAHENPAVKKIYDEFLEKPMSKKSKKILHTFFTKR